MEAGRGSEGGIEVVGREGEFSKHGEGGERDEVVGDLREKGGSKTSA